MNFIPDDLKLAPWNCFDGVKFVIWWVIRSWEVSQMEKRHGAVRASVLMHLLKKEGDAESWYVKERLQIWIARIKAAWSMGISEWR